MTLEQLLRDTGDYCHTFPSGAKQVFAKFGKEAVYYRLSDYLVSSRVSGPSMILVSKLTKKCRMMGLNHDLSTGLHITGFSVSVGEQSNLGGNHGETIQKT